MATAATALLAVTAASSVAKGVSSIGQGYVTSAQDKYNATMDNLKVQALQIQDQITTGQYTAKAGNTQSTQLAVAGAAGIEPTGSAAAVMLNAGTNIRTDAAIATFNNQLQQNYASAAASQENTAAKQAVTAGYTDAFSDLLTGTTNYAMYQYGGKNSFNSAGGASTASGDSSPNFGPLQLPNFGF